MKVGDKVWRFDFNRRVYPKTPGFSAPIYSEHFYPDIITGETSRSWILGNDKISKKSPFCLYTDEQKEDQIWANTYRYKIIDEVRTSDIKTLREVAKIVFK